MPVLQMQDIVWAELRPRGPDSASLDKSGWPTIRELRLDGRHPNGHIPGT
ncbi:hypothetical protein L195_g016205, partial [Trifolium pratense]